MKKRINKALAALTLNQALRVLGFKTTKSGGLYRKNILDDARNVVFQGTADDVWKWLHGLDLEEAAVVALERGGK